MYWIITSSFFAFCCLFVQTGWSAPPSYGYSPPAARQGGGEELTTVLRLLRTGLSDLQHEVRNQESEISLFEKKLQSQESSLEHFRSELTEDVQSQRDFVRASNVNTDGKIEVLDQSVKNLEGLMRGVTADLRQLKTQANDSVVLLGQYKQKIAEIETLLQTQNQHMQNLEAALQSIMEVWQAKEASKDVVKGFLNQSGVVNQTVEGSRTYVVQSGDSLEKIARTQHVTVQGLRDINQLTSDRIIIGQTLKIP